MNLTGFSLNNSRLVMLLVALLTVAGLGMLTNFPSKEDAFVTIRDAPSAVVWDTEDGRQLFGLEGHEKRIEDIVFAPDGTWIATLSRDDSVRAWEASTGEELHAWRPGFELDGYDLALHPARLVSGVAEPGFDDWDGVLASLHFGLDLR